MRGEREAILREQFLWAHGQLTSPFAFESKASNELRAAFSSSSSGLIIFLLTMFLDCVWTVLGLFRLCFDCLDCVKALNVTELCEARRRRAPWALGLTSIDSRACPRPTAPSTTTAIRKKTRDLHVFCELRISFYERKVCAHEFLTDANFKFNQQLKINNVNRRF